MSAATQSRAEPPSRSLCRRRDSNAHDSEAVRESSDRGEVEAEFPPRPTPRTDVEGREVARESGPALGVEAALAAALAGAAEAGRWDVVAQLAKELEARRLASAFNVVPIDTAKRGSR